MKELPDRWRELGEFIREQRGGARLSLRRLSDMAGISNPYLSQIERGLRKPSAEILQQIAKALRISAESLYVRAGILEERLSSVDLVDEILRDPSLTEDQRRTLVRVYLSFRHENGGAAVGGPPDGEPLEDLHDGSDSASAGGRDAAPAAGAPRVSPACRRPPAPGRRPARLRRSGRPRPGRAIPRARPRPTRRRSERPPPRCPAARGRPTPRRSPPGHRPAPRARRADVITTHAAPPEVGAGPG